MKRFTKTTALQIWIGIPPLILGVIICGCWDRTYVAHRFPFITDLRADPFEKASIRQNSFGYDEWHFRRAYLLVPAQGIVGGLIKSFIDYPPRSKPASFSVGDALKQLEAGVQGK